MMKTTSRRLAGAWMKRAHVWACASALLLGACGGGGGGGSEASGGTSTSTVSGLLPSAPTVGATLADDASTWRPLRDGSVYTYRGQHAAGNDTPTSYANTVTQVAQGGGMREDSTNTFNEGSDYSSSPVTLQSGAIHQQASLALADEVPPLSLDVIELKSPVRTNDRYVITDRHIADIGLDADGDKKNDGMDVAIWVQVMGMETLDLPNRTGVSTIHTQLTIRARVALSSGTQGPTVEQTLDIWYAAGIGQVKVRSNQPHPSLADARVINEETLLTYDGVIQGLGYTPQAKMSMTPGTSYITPVAIPYPYDATAFDAHIVAISNIPGAGSSAAGFTLTQLDTRGAVVAARDHTIAVTGAIGNGHTLVRLGNELRLLYIGSGNSLYMLRFSADGQTMLSSAPTLLLAGPFASLNDTYANFKVASSGGSLWIVTQTYWDSGTIDQTRLELRQFSGDGGQVGAARLIESGTEATRVAFITIKATDSQVMLLWRKGYITGTTTGHLLIDASTGAASPITAADIYANLGPCDYAGTTVLTDVARLVTCSVNQVPTAISLQPDGRVIGAADGSVRADALAPATWIINQASLNWLNNPNSDPQKLMFYGWRSGKFYAEDTYDTSFQEYAEVPLVNGLPDITGYRRLARPPWGVLVSQFAFGFGNRIVVVGGSCACQGGLMGTMLVWR